MANSLCYVVGDDFPVFHLARSVACAEDGQCFRDCPDCISPDAPVGNPWPHSCPRSLRLRFRTDGSGCQIIERIDACVLEPDKWTDGDSFRVRLPDGRLETFRLYFVDTIESRSRGKRSDEQAAYFGLTRAGAVALGKVAKVFTAEKLSRPFMIQTRRRKVFGPQRYYALVFTADGEDLCGLLVRNGLARIYGTRTPLPDGRTSSQYLAHLRQLERQAKAERLGGWKMWRKWLARSKPELALPRHDDH